MQRLINKNNYCESYDTVNITLEKPLGINDVDYNNDIIIFPNPTRGMFYVHGKNIEQIEVYNLQGQILKNIKGQKINIIDLGNQAKGIYFIKVIQEDKHLIKKLILE